MPSVSKSDIDQLVLGYIAEERYFQTRNQFFRESPHIPEKVPILSVFGDISSENRLQRILQEYVQFKTRQLVPLCAICEQCDSLPEMWKAFDRILQKIRNYKPPESPEPPPTIRPEIQRYSPSHIWHISNKAKSNKANAADNTEGAETLERKKLNPLSSEFETISVDSCKTKTTAGSARRKKSSVPRRLQNPSPNQIVEPYAHNGDLSRLLHTSDKNDALALVGLKILSNMKKCAEKGTSGAPNSGALCAPSPSPQPMEPFSPLKSSYGPSLDIEDLISEETRGGLVEMTIDSLLNTDASGPSKEPPSCAGSEDFSELRKLLEFDDTGSSCLTLPDLIQIQQDERDLIDIIKADDILPENSTPMPYEPMQIVAEHSEDEKHAVAGLLAIQSSTSAENTPHPPATISESETQPRNPCTTPTISNIRSENDSAIATVTSLISSDPTQRTESSEIVPETIVVEETQSRTKSNELLNTCATMPPKKRFLIKETMTPEKCRDRNSVPSTLSPQKVNSQVPRAHGNQIVEVLHTAVKESSIQSDMTNIISTAATLSNLELSFSQADTSESNLQIVVSPEPGSQQTTLSAIADHTDARNESNHSEESFAEHAPQPTSDTSVRRSRRPHKPNMALKDLIRKPRPGSSKTKKTDTTLTKKKNTATKKKTPVKLSKRSTAKSLTFASKSGTDSVVLSLKDCGGTPLHVSGIRVAVPTESSNKISKEDIISQLVGQVQKEQSKNLSKTAENTDIEVNVSSSKSSEVNTSTNPSTSEIHIQHDTPTICEVVKDGASNLLNVSQSQTAIQASHVSNVVVSELQPPPNLPCSQADSTQSNLISEDNATNQELTSPPLLLSMTVENQTPPTTDSPYMPISEESLMAALDISFLPHSSIAKSSSSAVFKTPTPTTHNLSKFSTISPGGVFSMIGGGMSPVKPTPLSTAKSNLLTSFLEEERVKGIELNNSDITIQENSFNKGSKYAELSNVTTSSMPPGDTGPIVSTPLDSKRTDANKMSKSMPPMSKRNIGKLKVDLGKRVLLPKQRTPSGILMCSKMKNMVRIEPKRHGVPAVKRYLVQRSQGTTEQHVTEPVVSLERITSESENLSQPHQNVSSLPVVGGGEESKNDHDEKSTSKKKKQKYDHQDAITPLKSQEAENTDQNATKTTSPQKKKLKRKNKRKSGEKKKKIKRLKLSADTPAAVKWSFTEIQAKLDSIHGTSQIGNVTENKSPDAKYAEEKNADMVKKSKSKQREKISHTSAVEVHEISETHCEKVTNTPNNEHFLKKNSDHNINPTSDVMLTENVAENEVTNSEHERHILEKCDHDVTAGTINPPTGTSDDIQTKNLPENGTIDAERGEQNLENCNHGLNPGMMTSETGANGVMKTEYIPENPAAVDAQPENQTSRAVVPLYHTPVEHNVPNNSSRAHSSVHISEESLWLPFDVQQVEPLDLSLSSWLCNTKSPFKNVPIMPPFSTSVSNDVGMPSVSGNDNPPLNREPLKEVASHKNSKHRKHSGKKGYSSKRFKRLEEKIKKVDLNNMDISKFLDSLNYRTT